MLPSAASRLLSWRKQYGEGLRPSDVSEGELEKLRRREVGNIGEVPAAMVLGRPSKTHPKLATPGA